MASGTEPIRARGIIVKYIQYRYSMNNNVTELEQVVHTHRQLCGSGWPRGLGKINAIPLSWIFTSVSWIQVLFPTYSLPVPSISPVSVFCTKVWHRIRYVTLHCTLEIRADKGWAVKRARPSKKMWCSGMGFPLEMSPVFDFGQGLRCGLSIRHCRCDWIMAAWAVFLHFFLVPLSCYAVFERQMLLFFFGRFSWIYWIIFSFYNPPMSMLFYNKNN